MLELRKCGNARPSTADISMILTEETEKARFQKEPDLKICPTTGNAMYAAQAGKCSDRLPGPGP